MPNINLRLEDDLHSRLKRQAKRHRRSLQQEIVNLLWFAYDTHDEKNDHHFGERGHVYVNVSGRDVIVTGQTEEDEAAPQEVYRIRPDGDETWSPGWGELGRQVIGDESTHHPADSVIGRAAQKIQAKIAKEATDGQ